MHLCQSQLGGLWREKEHSGPKEGTCEAPEEDAKCGRSPRLWVRCFTPCNGHVKRMGPVVVSIFQIRKQALREGMPCFQNPREQEVELRQCREWVSPEAWLLLGTSARLAG